MEQFKFTVGDTRKLPHLNKAAAVAAAPHRAVVELFAGIGLVRLGLEQQAFEVVFANDISPEKAEMYQANWPDNDHLAVADVCTLRGVDIPDGVLLTASFPCQDLSIAGRQDGLQGKESCLFWQVIRLLREMGSRRPPMASIENVPGFLTSHDGRDFEAAMLAFNGLGYLVDPVILDANHWTPQSRPRLFVVATRQGLALNGSTRATVSDARPKKLVDFINSHPNIRWGIRELPPLPQRTSQLADIVEDLPMDSSEWFDDEKANHFMERLSPMHAKKARKMIEAKSYSYATAFWRKRDGVSRPELRTDGLAGCLRVPSGGSSRQILFKAGKGTYQVRLLTPRECARLQGVPDNYPINVPANQALAGFGDAVCVPAVAWLAENYLKPVAQAIDEAFA